MKKPEMIACVAEKSGVDVGEVRKVLAAFFDILTEAILQKPKVTLVGFGSFIVKERAARSGRNPRTGEVIAIAAKKSVRFQPGRLLRDGFQK